MKLKLYYERSFDFPSKVFIAFIFFAKAEVPEDFDLVTMIVLFFALFKEDLRLVFFWLMLYFKIKFFFLQKKPGECAEKIIKNYAEKPKELL